MILGVWEVGDANLSHPLLENRVTQMDNLSGTSSHATHVSGTMIGDANQINGQAIGMAPLAELIAYDFNNDESEMTSEASQGMIISNHSSH